MLQKTRSLHLILFAILLAGCNSSNLASKVFKDKIQINGSEFEIHMFGYDSTESTGYFHPERIEIKENADADPIQTITDLNKYSELDAQGELIGFIDDYNFDGHPDFGFSIAEPMMGLDPYSLYLYNEKNKMFEFNDFLEMSPRVELNKERKELTFTAGRGDNYTKYTYKYKEGEFYVIKEVAEIYYYEDETRTVTTSELIGGEMKQTDFQKFMGMEGGNDIEIKKSGQMKGQKELANFLRMIDGQRETFDPVKLNGSEYLRWHDSCYNPGFSIIKYPVEDYEFDEFNLDVYPLLTWYVEGAEENYSIRSII